MEMQQVRYFVALVETLNFTRAAERCHVSQPSLTRAIKLLEDELGGLLFHRERNNTHLTELGRSIEPHLREIADQAQAARRRARSFAELRTARLKLGLARGVAPQPLDSVLQHYAMQYPDTEVEVVDDRPAELKAALDRGDLEVTLLQGGPEVDAFHHHTLVDDLPQVLIAKDHPLAAANGADLEALGGQTLICAQDCAFWPLVEAQLHERGITPRRRISAGSTDWLRPLVAAGLGIGLRGAAHGVPPGLVGRPLTDGPAAVPVQLVTKRGRLYSPPVKAFVEMALKPRRAA